MINTPSRGEGLLTTDPRLVRPIYWQNPKNGALGLATIPMCEFTQGFQLYSESGSNLLTAPAEAITLKLTAEFFWRRFWFARLVLNYASYVLRGKLQFSYQGQVTMEYPIDCADTVSGTAARYPYFQFPFSARLAQDGVENDEPDTIETPVGADHLIWHARHNISGESNFWHAKVVVAPMNIVVAADEVKILIDGWSAGSPISGTYGNVYFGLAVCSHNLPL